MDPSAMARALGRRGGMARAKKLSAAARRDIAARGAQARLESLRIARRIADNYAYLEAATELAPPIRVRRTSSSSGPLPNIAASHPK